MNMSATGGGMEHDGSWSPTFVKVDAITIAEREDIGHKALEARPRRGFFRTDFV